MDFPVISAAPTSTTSAERPRAPATSQATGTPVQASPTDTQTEQARTVARQQELAAQHSIKKPAQEAPPSVGRIRFEMQDGTNITKFFNPKDVLIYQVPPEGRLYLIKAQETADKDQIETSA